VLADPGLAAEAADLARRIAGEDATAPRRAAALRIAEAQVDIKRIRRVREQIMVEGFAAAGDITARLMRLDRYERRALSRRKSAIRAFDSLERPAAPRPRRNLWAAVAAAAKLGGLWQNEPDFGGTRDPWAAVAAAARLRGVWQNKPDFGRARLQRAAVAAAGRRAIRQNEADVAGAPAPCVPRPSVRVRLSSATITDRSRIVDFPTRPERPTLRAWLDREVALLYPGCFALVMATGIISNAFYLEGRHAVSPRAPGRPDTRECVRLPVG